MISFHSGSHVDVDIVDGRVRLLVTIIPANSGPLTHHAEFSLTDLPKGVEERMAFVFPFILKISNQPIAEHLVGGAVSQLNRKLFEGGFED